MSRRIFQASSKFWVLADQAVVSGSAFVTNILIAHALGIADYGRFSALVLTQLFLLGIQQSVSSGILQIMAPGYKLQEREFYIGGVFYGQCLLLLLIGLTGAGLYWFLPYMRVTFAGLFVPALTGTILFLAQDFLRKTLLTLDQVVRAFIMDALTNSIQLLALAA
ncbi:MAG TPA: hypothetical protein VN824_08085, partial [Puia sp.]|nr:hypothetical protein [Puia sp.]